MPEDGPPSETRPQRILIAGDLTVDWYSLRRVHPLDNNDENKAPNWQRYLGTRRWALPGGALMLEHFVKQAVDGGVQVCGPEDLGDLRVILPTQVIHSHASLKTIKGEKGNKDIPDRIRVEAKLGYDGPAESSVKIPGCIEPPGVIVIDDAGNGFRNADGVGDDGTFDAAKCAWPEWHEGANPLVVYKMSRPLAKGKLWDKISTSMERWVVIVNGHNIRGNFGVQIGKSLSWERTAKDFVFHYLRAPELEPLRKAPYLVVCFGNDGAILYRKSDRTATLFFDEKCLEGGFSDTIDGDMIGGTSIFTATIASSLLDEGGLDNLDNAIKSGLGMSRAFLAAGFNRGRKDQLEYPPLKDLEEPAEKHKYESIVIEPPASGAKSADPDFWRILDARTHNTGLKVARDLVETGKVKGLPVGKFGKLETLDRAEIESYSAIRELIVEFRKNKKPKRPLCFAVFGPPGSGKSFGVEQLVAQFEDLDLVTFNVSQFLSYKDLVAAFHDVRDLGLKGKVPFVFFDEFDSGSDEAPLNWLKYFLAPMQDGEFRDGEAVYHLGKAIFVFAGGTRSSFDKFSNDPRDVFKSAKGPDFVSRLRGYIDVMGPNRQHDADDAFIVRRAKLLRAMIERHSSCKKLFAADAELRIDPGILRALLQIGKYQHGSRSIEAILDMSQLSGHETFRLSSLPPKWQLQLHVDAEEFLALTEKERYPSMILAQSPDDAGDKKESDTSVGGQDGTASTAVPTRKERGKRKKRGQESPARREERRLIKRVAKKLHYSHVAWTWGRTREAPLFKRLDSVERKRFLEFAEDIPEKLHAINHGIRKIKEKGQEPAMLDISDEEVRVLMALERQRLGKRTKDPGDLDAKGHDALRFEIYSVPWALREVGLEIYRMEEAQSLVDPYLVRSIEDGLDEMAERIHDNYREFRKAEAERKGEPEPNDSSMNEFSQLHPNLQATNREQARTFPRPLFRLGYGVRKVAEGQPVPDLLDLSKEDKIGRLAKTEHARWNWQRIQQGWVWGSSKDNANKTHPNLLPWSRLEGDTQAYDLNFAKCIPQLLRDAGYEAFRLSKDDNSDEAE